MCFNKIYLFVLICSTTLFAQSKEELLNKILNHPNYKVDFITKNLIRIVDKINGNATYKDILCENKMPSDFVADLTIDLRTIDTTKYSELFTYWSEVPVLPTTLTIEDVNHDKRKEIYGAYDNYPGTDVYYVLYEINRNGTFDSILVYPDSLGLVRGITDLEKDGIFEVANGIFSDSSGWYLLFLSSDTSRGYPLKEKLIYDLPTRNTQETRLNFTDMDGDNYPEMIYYMDGTGDSAVCGYCNQIAKYDRVNNKLNLIYQNKPPTQYALGFAFGDYDSDGKQNFSVGSLHGEVFVYEYEQGNNYSLLRIDSLPITHAFLSTFTDDLDRNSKPELWIGGDTYINGVGSTVFYIYESDSDDSYRLVYTISIIGVISFFAGNLVPADIDNDGTDEVLLCIDQNVLVFKSVGSDYKLYYIKRNDLINQGSIFYTATAKDFDYDGYPEILISMDSYYNGMFRIFSRIYKKSSTVDIEESKEMIVDYSLSHAFPNPFNPNTTLKFSLPKEEKVTIKVFNVLGKEIKTILNETRNSGETQITWDGTDNKGNQVTSGVYIINMQAGLFNQNKKAVLLK
jgi:hypothetical protein